MIITPPSQMIADEEDMETAPPPDESLAEIDDSINDEELDKIIG